jgi:DNA-directed RNA polymerase specialized sigma24 family protein
MHADDAARARELYPQLRPFAAVVVAPGEDPNELVVEALARAIDAGPLARFDDPVADLQARILAAVDQSLPRLETLRSQRVLVRDASRYEIELWQLSSRDRAMLYLSMVDGLEPSQVGQIVGCSSWAARRDIARSLHELGSTPSGASTAFGVLAYRGESLTPDELIEALDEALIPPPPEVIIGRPDVIDEPSTAAKPGLWRIVVTLVVIAAMVAVLVLGSGVVSENDPEGDRQNPPTAPPTIINAAPDPLGSD